MPISQPASLPDRPDLEHLKKQAKELLRRAHDGDRDSLKQFQDAVRRFDPQAIDPKTLTLVEAQLTLARGYGFASWALLKEQVLRRRAEHLKSDGLPDDREERMNLMEQAIDQNDVETVKVLLAVDRSLAEGWGQRRPLQQAAQCDLPDVIDLLLDAGASFEPDHGWPHTPLSWSITTHSLAAARRLAERGVPVDLWCAAGLGDIERMRSFFDDRGQPIPNASRHGATRYDEQGNRLPKPPSDPVELISDALYIACRCGQVDAARFLLDHGANPSFAGYAVAPALHWAAFSGHHDVVELLLARGADAEQIDGRFRCKYRQFAVRGPIEDPWLAALKRALAGDPSLVHERDATWGPPLHAAAARGLVEHVRLLLESGADVRALDHAGRTVLECVALAENREGAEKIRALLQSG
jgi:ankyrin repeat protein